MGDSNNTFGLTIKPLSGMIWLYTVFCSRLPEGSCAACDACIEHVIIFNFTLVLS